MTLNRSIAALFCLLLATLSGCMPSAGGGSSSRHGINGTEAFPQGSTLAYPGADTTGAVANAAAGATGAVTWNDVLERNTFDAALAFVRSHPDSPHVTEAQTRFGRKATPDYRPKGMTVALYLDNGEPFALVEVAGELRFGRNGIDTEKGSFTMLTTAEDRDAWYAIVSCEPHESGIHVITENLHTYLIYGLSYNFTGHIKPLNSEP